jgi:hypothetical protein
MSVAEGARTTVVRIALAVPAAAEVPPPDTPDHRHADQKEDAASLCLSRHRSPLVLGTRGTVVRLGLVS